MKCSNCNSDLKATDQFCGNCGSPQGWARVFCSACGSENHHENDFCNSCGFQIFNPLVNCISCSNETKYFAPKCQICGNLHINKAANLGTSVSFHLKSKELPKPVSEKKKTSQPEGDDQRISDEKRIVTVMFADVAGFTAMSEKLDPEEVHDVMNRCFEGLTEAIKEQGGTIDKYIGDCIMALFGAPVAHEDDPIRAVRAGIKMREFLREFSGQLFEEQGLTLDMRIGINTGKVVAGYVGGSSDKDFTVMGDGVNLASRLEKACPIGGILISHDTYVQARGPFKYKKLEPIKVKGKEKPIQTYEVLSENLEDNSAHDFSDSLEIEFIGRQNSLDKAIAHYSNRSEMVHMIEVLGESGVGKTRFANEIKRHISSKTPNWRFYMVQCHPHHKNAPNAIIQNLLKTLLLGRAQISPNEIFGVVKDLIQPHFPEGRDYRKGQERRGQNSPDERYRIFRETIILVSELLGAELSGENEEWLKAIKSEPKRLSQMLRSAVRNVIQRFSDDKSIFITIDDAQWCDPTTMETMAFIQSTLESRNVFIVFTSRKPIDSVPFQGDNYLRIRLNPFDSDENESFISTLLKPLVEKSSYLQDIIIQKGGGNPFFIQELVRYLIDQGTIEVEDEHTWHLRANEVSEISLPVSIESAIQSIIDNLDHEEKNLVQKAAVIGKVFWLDLLVKLGGNVEQNIVKSLCKKGIFEPNSDASYGDHQAFAFSNLLFKEVAYENVLSKVRRKLHVSAVEWMEDTFAQNLEEYFELIAFHCRNARDNKKYGKYLCLLTKKSIALYANHQALDYAQEIIKLFSESKKQDHDMLAEAFLLLGKIQLNLSNFDQAQKSLNESLEHINLGVSDLSSREDLKNEVFYYLYKTFEYRGEIEKAKGWAERLIELGEKYQRNDVISRGNRALGVSLYRLGQYEKAMGFLENSLKFKSNEDIEHAKAINNIGVIHSMRGDYQSALDYFMKALAIRSTLGDRQGESIMCHNIAMNQEKLANFSDAFESNARAISVSQTINDQFGVAAGFMHKGHLYNELKLFKKGYDAYTEGLVIAFREKINILVSEAYLGQAFSLLNLGELDQAAESIKQARNNSKKDSIHELVLRANLYDGFLKFHKGDLKDAAKILQDAYEVSKKNGEKDFIARSMIYLARTNLELGEIEEFQLLIEEVLNFANANNLRSLLLPIYETLIRNQQTLPPNMITNWESHAAEYKTLVEEIKEGFNSSNGLEVASKDLSLESHEIQLQ